MSVGLYSKPSMKIKLSYLIPALVALPILVRAQFAFTTNTDGTLNISQYTGTGSAVTIPDTSGGLRVTTVGSDAFYQDYTVTSITIGTNVAAIAQNAVFQCTTLASVTLPASVTNIAAGPFIDCLSLTAISFSASNQYYLSTNQILFNRSQTSLIEFPGGVGGSYTIAAAVTNVGEAFIGNTLTAIAVNSTNPFYSSTNGVLFNKNHSALLEYPGAAMGNYSVPTNVIIIGSAAFEYSTGLTGVTIGTNVTGIQSFAFYDCSALTNISVNPTNFFYSSTNGVLFDKKQTDLIQYPCAAAGSYVIPATVTNLENGSFGDAFGLTSVVIPNSVTSIGSQTFYSCENLGSVSLGDGVTSIGQQAFYYCTSLTDVAIPNSVTNIATLAFYYCPGLVSVTFGASLKYLGREAFGDCQNLTNACFAGPEPTDGGSVFYFGLSLSTINYVTGAAGWGAAYDGYSTTPCQECAVESPQLGIVRAGIKVIVAWPTSFTGFTLQSTTNLAAPVWANVSPAPVVINNLYVVTNSPVVKQTFYRLKNP